MQLRFRHIARNVLSSWVSTVASMAVGFFLSPFVVHRLGNVAYGVWVLSISSVSYLALLDLGLRSSVLRFVSKERAVGNHAGASETFSAALWVRLQIGMAVLLLSGVLAALFPLLFRIPQEMRHSSQLAVMLIGVTTSLNLCSGVFGGVLSAVNRYDLQTAITLLAIIVRVSGVVLALTHGWGLIGVACAEVLAAVTGGTFVLWTATRAYPELRVRLVRPKREVLRSLWSYSFYVFLQTIAIQLVYQTDNLVVGSFVSASAVTFYAIGNSLCRYTDQFAGAMGLTFVPAASTFDSSGEPARLKALYRIGTRSILCVSLPILVTLLVRGHTFIRLWMGQQYAGPSGTVLVLLAVPLVFSLANNPAGAVAMGTDRHRFVAKWAIAEGVSNLLLSVWLVHPFGIYGVALGTMLPSLLVHVVVWPGRISRMFDMSRREVLVHIWGTVLAAALPFALASLIVDRTVQVHSIAAFFLQTLLLLPVFAGMLLLVFRGAFHRYILPTLRSRFRGSRVVAA